MDGGLSLTPMSGELDQREFRIIFLILVDVTVESVYGHRSAVSEAAVLACASVGCRQFFCGVSQFLSRAELVQPRSMPSHRGRPQTLDEDYHSGSGWTAAVDRLQQKKLSNYLDVLVLLKDT